MKISIEKKLDVAICCPCYESEAYIQETVRSFLNQSYQPSAIIISDDCSSDQTYEAIKKNFQSPLLQVFHQTLNLGPSLNARFTVDQTQAELICLCAGDDVMHPDRLKECYAFMEQHPECDVVYTFVQTIDENGKPIDHPMMSVFNQEKKSSDLLHWFFYEGNFICATSVMLRRRVLETLDWDPCLLRLQDFDLWVKMSLQGFQIKCLPQKLTSYRIHPKNLSRIRSRKRGTDSICFFEHQQVLQHYATHLVTCSAFEAVFKKSVQQEEWLPFLMAQEALKANQVPHYYFARNILYQAMQDPQKREIFREVFHFSMRNFYQLAHEDPAYHHSWWGFLKLFLKQFL